MAWFRGSQAPFLHGCGSTHPLGRRISVPRPVSYPASRLTILGHAESSPKGWRTMALIQVRTPGTKGAQLDLSAAAAPTSGTVPRWQVVVASFAAVLVVWLVGVAINANSKPTALVVPTGISLFAVLYAVTQGLERLLEPVSAFFFSTKQHAENRNATLAAAVNLQTATDAELPTKLSDLAQAARAAEDLQQNEPARRLSATAGRLRRNVATEGVSAARERVAAQVLPALEADVRDPEGVLTTLANVLEVPTGEAAAVTKKTALELAAAAQSELDQRRADKAVAYWALASGLGLLLSATMGLYLLHIVGLRGDGLTTDGSWTSGVLSAAGVRHMLDILVTGLAIGGGTKPLHDLISSLQTAKDDRKDPSQTR